MSGNAAEWVADWKQGNANPWSMQATATLNSATYGNDVVYGVNPATAQSTSQNFPSTMIRGGATSEGTGIGIFALNASAAPSYTADVLCSRCGK
jgi:hypothetical protein